MNSLSISSCRVTAYTIPTDEPESDGPLDWKETTLVLVELMAGGQTGIGYTYSSVSSGLPIYEKLAEILQGSDPMKIPQLEASLHASLRNIGTLGPVAASLSAVNNALWDLNAKHLNRLRHIEAARQLAVVEPGCILDDLRHAAGHRHGLTFGADPSTHTHCTLAGMLGNDSCGTHSVLAAFYGPGARVADNTLESKNQTTPGFACVSGQPARMNCDATSSLW